MKILIWMLWLIFFTQNMSAQSSFFHDSANTVLLEGTISRGIIESSSSDIPTVKQEIVNQLYYSLGFFNGLSAGVKLRHLKIQITRATDLQVNHHYVYEAQLKIVWPIERKIPDSLDLILPKRGDQKFLQGPWYSQYAQNKKKVDGYQCFESGQYQMLQSNFWYHYRPLNKNCLLSKHQNSDEDLAISFPIGFKKSSFNTDGKFPEYQEIWKDNKLSLFYIQSVADKKSPNPQKDIGILNVRNLYQKWKNSLGKIVSNSLQEGELPGLDHPTIELLFEQKDGKKIEIKILLAGELNIDSVKSLFFYNKNIGAADVIIYSGHAGLGSNIYFLERVGNFIKDKYQIFYLDACDSFSYTDGTLEKRHQVVNEGFEWSKHLDIITNAMPSYFASADNSIFSLVQELINQKKNYRELLFLIDPYQRAFVSGEEDNHYPLPF